MKRITFATACILLLLFFINPEPAHALKKRIRAARAVYSTVKLSRATRSAVATFYAVPGVSRFGYTLSYTANGIPQGVVGSFVASGTNETRDLYFGTCSKSVCTPHYGISRATLTITATMKNGATYIKRYIFRSI